MTYHPQTLFYLLTEVDANRLHSLAAALSRAVDDLLVARQQAIDNDDYDLNEMRVHEAAFEISKSAKKESMASPEAF